MIVRTEGLEMKDWADALARTNNAVPTLEDEADWRKWVDDLIRSQPFISGKYLRHETFISFREWAERFVGINS